MDQIRLDPQDKLSPTSHPPTPRTRCQQNTLPPQDKKVPAAHPPPLRIISGTALRTASCALTGYTYCSSISSSSAKVVVGVVGLLLLLLIVYSFNTLKSCQGTSVRGAMVILQITTTRRVIQARSKPSERGGSFSPKSGPMRPEGLQRAVGTPLLEGVVGGRLLREILK